MIASSVLPFVEETWHRSIVPALEDYIRIPNESPAFDPLWREHGHMDRAAEHVAGWMRTHGPPAMQLEVVRLPGRTPLVFAEIPGSGEETVLLYGHLDKQPPMAGWLEGLGPWTPVIREGRLYGRGGADDGYAAFAAVTAIAALEQAGVPHARCAIVIEACEESGSIDLPCYIDRLQARIGTPSLVVCLDSGCGNYDQLWITTSLRGLLAGTLRVSTLTEGVHSGKASGIVPSSFRIARGLLERLEDARTGEIRPRGLHVEIPAERRAQARDAAAVLGGGLFAEFPFQPGVRPAANDVEESILNQTWRPQLEIVGAEGLPGLQRAGNVLRPFTSLKLSLRLPPTLDAQTAAAVMAGLLTEEPPAGARVEFEPEQEADGWNAPPVAAWLAAAAQTASIEAFGREACWLGEGGTIPFMSMLGKRFPMAQFMITGVLGPRSNAHGPNEFLDLSAGVKLTACVAAAIAAHAAAHGVPCSETG
ncbi:M20/M25/M40 family metallo-hydrolase [Candidatus Binatia bacterium]|nr:M20/M25/M40 family metallo-hydrolase [Candidatus Binatia bacterium]